MLAHKCPGCGKLIPYGIPRCAKCAEALAARMASRKKKGSHYTDPKIKAFYASDEWKGLSIATIAKAKYVCHDCGGRAVEVHHLVPIQTEEGWEMRFDPTHVIALCTRCHNARHGRFSTKHSTKREVFNVENPGAC